MKSIYLAGPISGESYEGVMAHINKRRWILEPHYEVLHPMTGKSYLRTETKFKAVGYDNPVSTNRAIVGRDHWMVNQCDILYADLINTEIVSIGTVCEIAWAYEMRKLVILALEEVNIHQHAFVLEMADTIFPSVEEANLYLIKLAGGIE